MMGVLHKKPDTKKIEIHSRRSSQYISMVDNAWQWIRQFSMGAFVQCCDNSHDVLGCSVKLCCDGCRYQKYIVVVESNETAVIFLAIFPGTIPASLIQVSNAWINISDDEILLLFFSFFFYRNWWLFYWLKINEFCLFFFVLFCMLNNNNNN